MTIRACISWTRLNKLFAFAHRKHLYLYKVWSAWPSTLSRCTCCRFPSSSRFSIGVCLVFHGLKSPRLFNFASFRRHWYTDIIKPEAWKPPAIHVRVFQTHFLDYPSFWRWVRLKDAMPERANSRGFLNPWYSGVFHTSAVCKDGNRQLRTIWYADFSRLLNRPFWHHFAL